MRQISAGIYNASPTIPTLQSCKHKHIFWCLQEQYVFGTFGTIESRATKLQNLVISSFGTLKKTLRNCLPLILQCTTKILNQEKEMHKATRKAYF